jgi:hypothetical protein
VGVGYVMSGGGKGCIGMLFVLCGYQIKYGVVCICVCVI